MTLSIQRRIVGTKDSCSVSRNEDGSIYIGAILLHPDESDEFPKLLHQAIDDVKQQAPPPPQK